MLGHAHAGLGWLIGAATPGSERRLRIWCTAAALLPDVDALAILAGKEYYDRFHHTFGHNIFTGALCVFAAACAFRKASTRFWLTAIAAVAIAFASHILTDMKLSGWELHLLWPLNRRGFEFHPNLQLGHPINLVFAALLGLLPWLLPRWREATPFEIVSSRLDRLFMNLFRPRNRECSTCGRACNNRCDDCTKPVCLRHGKIGGRFRLRCPSCAAAGPAARKSAAGIEETLARELGFLRSREVQRVDPEFATLLERKLSDGLKRLDAVPRTNPLWEGSDQRPTLAKVVDLCRVLLKEAPDDEEARWVLFADSVRCSAADLGFAAIEPLILRDFASLHWLVAAARWNYVLAGVDPVVALRGPFESLRKTLGSLESCLDDLARGPDARTREAAARCLDLLYGKNPFKASSSQTPG